MRCFKIRERLVTDYRDGELGKREIAQIEEHLRGCEACRELFEEVTRFATLPRPERGIEMEPDSAFGKISIEKFHESGVRRAGYKVYWIL